MPADADPAFEVVTIKPSDRQSPHGTFFTTRGRHSIASNVTVIDLISYVYGLHTRQILDGPSWVAETRFEIDGVPDIEGHPNRKQSKLMFQKLLASRFKLAFHPDSRDLLVYAVVLAKDGPKLTKTDRKPGDSTTFSYTSQVVLTVLNASMADFVDGMQAAFMDKPVVDQTGLKDRYDFALKWTPDETPASDSDAPPGLYTAIQEQLGLKLVSTKAPVNVFVIDHIQRPSEN